MRSPTLREIDSLPKLMSLIRPSERALLYNATASKPGGGRRLLPGYRAELQRRALKEAVHA